MAETFRAAGIATEALDGTTPLATRRAILFRLHTGETRVVANCAVLTGRLPDEPSGRLHYRGAAHPECGALSAKMLSP